MTADDSRGPDGHASRQVPARVASSIKVNVAAAVPGPEAEVLRRRVHESASQVR